MCVILSKYIQDYPMASYMKDLTTSYGIDFNDFQDLMLNAQAIVAGSAALAGYLKEKGIDPGFEPNDMDIFIPGCVWTYDYLILEDFENLLVSSGFIYSDKFTASNYDSLTSIDSIMCFTKDDKEIQLIIIKCSQIVDFIIKDFDLSICITWWDPSKYKLDGCGGFETIDFVVTEQKKMYRTRATLESEWAIVKRDLRIQKYESRGFTLIDNPCPFILTRDTRTEIDTDKFANIDVCDIFSLEEMPLKDFLRSSEWNIVIKAGERYYAFDRRALTNYMKTKKTYVNKSLEYVYETPFNQCISLKALERLSYADYSIFELISDRSVITEKGVKSLFHIHCYSLKHWIEENPIVIVSCPKESATSPSLYTQALAQARAE